MNKAQLIEQLAQRMGGDKRQASAAVEGVVDIVVRTVTGGENVTITGFGVFEKRSRAARVARNPRTGETVRVEPTAVPSFRPGVNFKAVVSGESVLPADGPAVRRSATGRAAAAPAKQAPARKAAPAKAAPAKAAPAKKAVPAKAAPAKAARPTSATAKTAAAAAAAKTTKAKKVDKTEKADDKKKKTHKKK